MSGRRFLAVVLFVLGCAAQPPKRVWTATVDSPPPLEETRARCEKEAVAAAGKAPGQAQGLGASAAGGTLIDCMRKAGWELRPAPE